MGEEVRVKTKEPTEEELAQRIVKQAIIFDNNRITSCQVFSRPSFLRRIELKTPQLDITLDPMGGIGLTGEAGALKKGSEWWLGCMGNGFTLETKIGKAHLGRTSS